MAISFFRPYALILIPILIFIVLFSSRKIRKTGLGNKMYLAYFRCFIITLIILALAGISIKWRSDITSTIFIVDMSDSVQNLKQAEEEFIKDAIKTKPKKDKIGVVTFGDNAQIENFITKDINFNEIASKPNGMYTNIENAVTASLALMPEDSKKRIVLITDCQENEGKAAKLVPSIKEQGVDLKVYKLNNTTGNEVAVDSVTAPQSVNIDEEFNLTVEITSTVNTGAKLTLFNGRQVTAQERIQVTKGNNKFVFKDIAKEGGFKNYKAVIEPDIDTEIKNNESSAFTNVKDKPKILVIEDKAGEANEIVNMLRSLSLNFTKIMSSEAPHSLQELTTYKSIITCNVSADKLNEDFLKSLEVYVRDFGGGLISTGGDNSFALGGYFKTSLEKVLPVNMELKGKKEIPDMAMMLIIDKSGSMMEGNGGITKVDIAKEAAIRTLDSLRAKDEIGVLTFDDTLYWVEKLKKAGNKESIRDDIGTIRPGGGTSILPALKEGYQSLMKSSAKIKHIILLTDGQAEQYGYDELISQINKDNITISTVAVGRDADTNLLSNIAKKANGRFYSTDDISSIPKIFAKETFMAAKAYLNNREFTPIISSSDAILSGAAENGLPSLLGYIGATPKDTAKVILKSDEDDPILTVWQYGLGKTAAWNSDISGKWSANYVRWEKNTKFWQNIINYTISNHDSEDSSIEASIEGNKANIKFKSDKYGDNVNASATIITPSLQEKQIKLLPDSPGKYSGNFDIKEPGVYMLKGEQLKGKEVIGSASSGVAIQYSPEYKINPEVSSLDALVTDANGKYINSSEDVFKGEVKNVTGSRELTNYLLGLSLLLFIVDIALRRLNIFTGKLDKIINILRERANKHIPKNFGENSPTNKRNLTMSTDSENIYGPAENKKQIAGELKEIKDKAKGKKKKSEGEGMQSLDTSTLLKKKQNRDM